MVTLFTKHIHYVIPNTSLIRRQNSNYSRFDERLRTYCLPMVKQMENLSTSTQVFISNWIPPELHRIGNPICQ